MDFQTEYRDGCLLASGDMTIYFAAAMKDQLLAALAASDTELLLDLSQVSEFDTCGLQIVLLARREAAATDRRLTLVEPSAAVREVLRLCGLDELLGDDAQAVA